LRSSAGDHTSRNRPYEISGLLRIHDVSMSPAVMPLSPNHHTSTL
jgi:hypothetical protein